MERAIAGFLMLIGFLMLVPANFSFAQQTTLCISQFALANQACGVLPSEQALTRSRNHTRSQADDSDSGSSSSNDGDEDDDKDNSNNDDGEDDGDDDEGRDETERRRKRSRGRKRKGRKRGRGHKHKRGGEHDDDDEPRADKDCCRWLEELDERCVCAALLRLPPFLVKPTHKYSIKVGKTCKFSYNCYGI